MEIPKSLTCMTDKAIVQMICFFLRVSTKEQKKKQIKSFVLVSFVINLSYRKLKFADDRAKSTAKLKV